MHPAQLTEYLKALGELLLSPYVLFREIREQIWFWKTRGHSRRRSKGGEQKELKALVDRIARYSTEAPLRREKLCQGVVANLFIDRSSPAAFAALRLLSEIIEYEGFLSVPDIDAGSRKLSTSEMWEKTGELSRIIDSFDKPQELEERLEKLLRAILLESDLGARESRNGEEAELSVPLYVLLPDPVQAVERILGAILSEERIESRFFRLWPQLERNLLIASGIDPSVENSRQPIWPGKARMETVEIIDSYLCDTPFSTFLQTSVPFGMPFSSRFEHTHIVGGSGHGKTQLLQQMILKDLDKLVEGKGSVIVIDSQGDLLRNILSLASNEHAFSAPGSY